MRTGQHQQRPTPPLRAIREARGLTLTEAARRAGIDPGHLSRVERGKAGLSLDALARLARVLDLGALAHLLERYRSAA